MVGVGAVVWDGQHVLLERRGRPPGQGTWALPGGLVEVGETVEAALVREIREECNIEVRPGPILGLFQPIERDAEGRVRYHYVVIDLLAFYERGDIEAGDDAAEACWVLPEALPNYELSTIGRAMIARALTIVRPGHQRATPGRTFAPDS
jgi:8-oxo-dGTP diphosphatase